MSPYEIIAQTIGIVGMCFQIASFQFKDVKKLYISQILAATLSIIHYLMLGGYSGMAMNMVGLSRCLCLSAKNKKFQSKIALAAILTFDAALAFLTVPADGLIGLFPVCAQFIGTCSLWTRNNLVIHLIQCFLLSPAWEIYSIAVGSISGCLTEIFTVISIVIYFWTEHKNKKESSV